MYKENKKTFAHTYNHTCDNPDWALLYSCQQRNKMVLLRTPFFCTSIEQQTGAIVHAFQLHTSENPAKLNRNKLGGSVQVQPSLQDHIGHNNQ